MNIRAGSPSAVAERPGVRTRPRVPVQRAGRTPFRADLEGLRGVAILLVVAAGVGVPGLGGGRAGAEVFFVLSGFLITGMLDRASLPRFWARRAVRLLPSAALVIMLTVVAAWLWLPPGAVRGYAYDALAAAFGAGNLRAEPGSPFHHLWALAVTEQFLLLWPLLIMFAGWVGNRIGSLHRRQCTAVVLAVVTAGSFWLGTRAWEFGAGALLALGSRRLARLGGSVAAALGWVGVGLVAGSAFGLRAGPEALLPVAGTALLIAAGANAPRHGVPALLGHHRLQALGRLSYGWYLWHWPVLVIGPAALGVAAGLATRVLLAGGALGFAVITYHLVEDPIRRRRILRDQPVRGLKAGAALCCVAGLTAVVGAVWPPAVEAPPRAQDLRAVVAGAADPTRTMAVVVAAAGAVGELPSNLTPSVAQAGSDRPRVYADHCHVDSQTTAVPLPCTYGDPAAKTTVVLFGDSHAAQWFPALDLIARQRHWKLISWTRTGCPAADLPVTLGDAACPVWRKAALQRIEKLEAALVVLASGTGYRPAGAGDADRRWRTGWARTQQQLLDAGARVVTIGDTPYLPVAAPECLSRRSPGSCAPPRGAVLRGPGQRAAGPVIDPIPWMCGDRCPPVLGNVLAYRDAEHLTTVFAVALAPLLSRALPAV